MEDKQKLVHEIKCKWNWWECREISEIHDSFFLTIATSMSTCLPFLACLLFPSNPLAVSLAQDKFGQLHYIYEMYM